jgi:AbrB family looped-hinge helix DNA binding protein
MNNAGQGEEAMRERTGCRLEDATYGMVTVGERGQMVIPAEARRDLGIEPGDKLIVMRHPMYAGFIVFKMQSVREFLEMFQREVERLEKEFVQVGGDEE